MFLLDKYSLPLFSPETEAGATPEEGTSPPQVPLNDRPVDGPGSGRSTLKRQLEEGFEQDRKAREKEEQPAKRTRGVNHVEEPETPEPTDEENLEDQLPPEEEGTEPTEPQKLAPPASFSKEAKAEWEKTPPTIQAAILKREQDVEKGISQLKSKYSDLEQVLAPRLDMLRQHNQTPAQGIDRLFKWMEALQGNPDQAFPALLQSFNYDPNRLFAILNGQDPGQQQPPQQPQPEEAGDIPPALRQYIGTLEQKLQALEQGVGQEVNMLRQNFMSQTQAKTAEYLEAWSKDKPYFDDVRETMGRLMLPGPNGEPPVVAPLPNGNADLDKAYETAIWALPEVRAKVIAEQRARAKEALKARQEAERKAQAEQAEKARRSGGSLAPSAPGVPGEGGQRKGKGKSVRESLAEAIKEVRS